MKKERKRLICDSTYLCQMNLWTLVYAWLGIESTTLVYQEYTPNNRANQTGQEAFLKVILESGICLSEEPIMRSIEK